MTFEEARKILERELLAVILESNVSKETQQKRLNEKFKALNVALEAIDKQIPKKFEIDEWYPKDRFCPRCFEDFTKTDARCRDYEPWRYCPSCGQALDWSDTDD